MVHKDPREILDLIECWVVTITRGSQGYRTGTFVHFTLLLIQYSV